MTDKKRYETVDEYVADLPHNVQVVLEDLRKSIRALLPDATETISYQIPAFKLNGKYVVYFAGYKSHVSLYPIPPGDESFEAEIAPYKRGKGTIGFPLDQPIPYNLVSNVVGLLLKQNKSRSKR